MESTLSTAKYYREITLRSWKVESIALEEQMDFLSAMQNKAILQMPDWWILNASAIAYAKPINPDSPILSDSWMAYAKSLWWKLRDVAIERVVSYENIPFNWKMSARKLQDWLKAFREDMDEYPAYKKIYQWI